MKVKVCVSVEDDYGEDLEEKIQKALDAMQEKGFFLKHISHSSVYDDDNELIEKTAVLIFDSQK